MRLAFRRVVDTEAACPAGHIASDIAMLPAAAASSAAIAAACLWWASPAQTLPLSLLRPWAYPWGEVPHP